MPVQRWIVLTSAGLLSIALFGISILSRKSRTSEIVAFDRNDDGTRIALGLKSGTAVILDISGTQVLEELRVPHCSGAWTNAVSFTAPGEIACAGESLGLLRAGTVHQLEVPSAQSGGAFGSAAMVGNDLVVITASERLLLIDGKTGEVKRSLDEHTALYGDLRTSADGKFLAASGHTVHVWLIGNGTPGDARELAHSYYTFGPIAFGSDRLYVGNQDGCVYRWQMIDWTQLPRICPNQGTVSQIAVSSDGKQIAIAARQLTLYTADTAHPIFTIDRDAHAGVAFLRDGRLATATARSLDVWKCMPSKCIVDAAWDVLK